MAAVVYTPTVVLPISLGAPASAAVVRTPSIGLGSNITLDALLTSGGSVPSPAVLWGACLSLGAPIASGVTLYEPELTAGAAVSPPLLESAAEGYSATVSLAMDGAEPASAATFPEATLLDAALVEPELGASEVAFYAAEVAADWPLTLEASIPAGAAPPSPVVQSGLAPSFIGSGAALYGPIVSTAKLTPSFLASTAYVLKPHLRWGMAISLGAPIASTNSLPSPRLDLGVAQ